MDGYKHYIRTNESGIVIYGFSSAFEQPLEGDILYAEDTGRHFNLQLVGERYQWRYKRENGELIERSQLELDAEWEARPPDPPTELDIIGQQLVEKDIQIMQLQTDNAVLGQQVVDLDIRMMIGGI